MSATANKKFAAPCGLYCGVCIDRLVYESCHGCGCLCGKCDATEHHQQCNIYKCCVEEKKLADCSECSEFPCTQVIQFCYNPVWLHHLPVLENLERRKTIGIRKWLEEQEKFWENNWYRCAWLWFQKQCEKRLKESLKKAKDFQS